MECGWEDQVRLLCKDKIKSKEGKVTADEMYDAVVQEARAKVPTTVKRELLQKIKNSLMQNEELLDWNLKTFLLLNYQ